MHKRTSNLEWQFAESDADWQRWQESALPDIPAADSGRQRLQDYCWGVVALLLLLATGGHWWWGMFPDRRQQTQVTAMPHQAVSGVASRTGNPSDPGWWLQPGWEVRGLRAAIQIAEPEAHLEVELHTVEVQGDQVAARVVMHTEHGVRVYRQTRFYLRTAAGWQQTLPDEALWGPERSLETLFVTFYFRQQDALAVIAVAPQVNNLYTSLRRNLGLPRKAWEEKLVIDVSVTQSPGHTAPQPLGSDRFMVASPAVYMAPVELTDAELLAQSIALSLIEQALAQAREYHAIGSAWQPLLDGLRLWQVWDLDLPLATWRDDVVTWLYADEPAVPPGQPVVLPDYYGDLCAAHKLWLAAPTQLGIPLLCAELDGKDWYFAPWGLRDALIHLEQFALPVSLDEYIGQASTSYVSPPGQTVALATLIDYAVATYGRDRLPALVAGLGQYQSWDTLLPAVYDVSTAEFEAGWQAYLATHYRVSPIRR